MRSANLCKELKVPPNEPYLFSIMHCGIKGRASYAFRHEYLGYTVFPRISQEDSHVWQREITQDLIRSHLTELTHQIASDLFALFDFTEVSKGLVDKVLRESRNERGEPLL